MMGATPGQGRRPRRKRFPIRRDRCQKRGRADVAEPVDARDLRDYVLFMSNTGLRPDVNGAGYW